MNWSQFWQILHQTLHSFVFFVGGFYFIDKILLRKMLSSIWGKKSSRQIYITSFDSSSSVLAPPLSYVKHEFSAKQFIFFYFEEKKGKFSWKIDRFSIQMFFTIWMKWKIRFINLNNSCFFCEFQQFVMKFVRVFRKSTTTTNQIMEKIHFYKTIFQ